MMLRVALARLCKSSPPVVAAGGIRRSVHHSILRPFSTPSAAEPEDLSPFTLHTINLAIHYARSYNSDESYEAARQMLEQQIASQSQEGQGMALLALSTLLFERGNTREARRTLLKIQDLTSCCLATRVAAFEALVGLHLEMGRDVASSVYADKGFRLSHFQKDAQQIRDVSGIEVLHAQAKAIKGLVQLVQGDLYSADATFQGFADKSYTGNAALSFGAYLHIKGDFAAAKEIYESVISESAEKVDFIGPGNDVAACNMASEEVLLAATCALGQLQSHLGNYGDAVGTLRKALKLAEERFGSNHPKFATVLTCIALMYHHMEIFMRSYSHIIVEGICRLAITLLKAPPIEKDGGVETVANRDIVAVTRGLYGETLCRAHDPNAHPLVRAAWKAEEGEKIKKWAESAWKSRISLDGALDFSQFYVIDTRTCRVI